MKYRYSGPTSGVTLQKGEEAQEVMLHTGTEVELPEEHEYTKTLLALGHLTPLGSQTRPATKTSARSAGADDQRKSLADEPAAKGA